MRLKLLHKILFFILGFYPFFAIASDVKIGVLSERYCGVEDFNSNVYLASKSPDILVGQCVLTFLRESKDGRPFEYVEYETEALIRVDGTLLHLHRKNKDFYEFESDDGAVTVILNSQEIDTSCVEGVDSCCGSNYSGSLTVKTARGNASVRVSYYRGG